MYKFYETAGSIHIGAFLIRNSVKIPWLESVGLHRTLADSCRLHSQSLLDWVLVEFARVLQTQPGLNIQNWPMSHWHSPGFESCRTLPECVGQCKVLQRAQKEARVWMLSNKKIAILASNVEWNRHDARARVLWRSAKVVAMSQTAENKLRNVILANVGVELTSRI